MCESSEWCLPGREALLLLALFCRQTLASQTVSTAVTWYTEDTRLCDCIQGFKAVFCELNRQQNIFSVDRDEFYFPDMGHKENVFIGQPTVQSSGNRIP